MNYSFIDEIIDDTPKKYGIGVRVQINEKYPVNTELDRSKHGQTGTIIERRTQYWRVKIDNSDYSLLCYQNELDII